MNTRIKSTMKGLAKTCKALNIPYERKDTSEIITVDIGGNLDHVELEIEKSTGLYSCWGNSIPTSFHYDDDEEIWMGTTYNIKRYPIKGREMHMLWTCFVNMPHAGHYEKTK